LDIGDELSGWYPEQFVSLEAEVERTEGALLHQVPEDAVTGRLSLLALRSGLSDVSRDMDDQPQSDAAP
jgi:hypothetical protein